MAKQKGSDMLLKIDTASSGGPTFTSVAGLQTKSLQLDSEQVDVTNQDSANKWRELLEGAGIRKARISGSGVFTDATAENTVMTVFMAGTIKQWQIIVPGLGTFQGLMQIANVEWQGPHDKEVSYSISLESAGDLTYTAS
tara:strand:- start:305 stop:724 length:420 start_codon:yes stop_codon:yes gene_type:complete